MRIAVFSDIHGNCFALDQVLADLQRHPVDQLVCLGDAVQGGARPAETVARLRELGCPIVMGNADAWLLTGEVTSDNEAISEEQEAVRQWSLARLSSDDRAFIASFQPTVELPLEGGRRLLCFHGSPTSFDDLIFPETPEDEFVRLLGPFAPAILTGGHTHLQQVRRLGETFFFNPGSVGVAYDRNQPDDAGRRLDPWAEYGVLSSEGDRLALEFRRVPYDAGPLMAIIQASGRPYAEAMAAEYSARAE
ncbi:MAG TPA: metallophosphoesterase family protein [Ktedonobacterales bacterium]